MVATTSVATNLRMECLRSRLEPVVGRDRRPPGGPPLRCRTRPHVKVECFQIVTSVTELPLGRPRRAAAIGSRSLEIAEPGAEFQVTDMIDTPRLPIRRLVAAGLVYHERGGIGQTWRVARYGESQSGSLG